MQLAATLAAPMTFLAIAPFGLPVAIASGFAATVLLITLLQLRAPTITVDEVNLRVGRITIPVRFLGSSESFRGAAAFSQRGPQLDPRAARVLIGDIDPVVKVAITDSADPTPYLLLSTRAPERLVKVISTLQH